MEINEWQIVSLVPRDHHDGLNAVGLYLTRPEFEEIFRLRKHIFDPEFLDFIFKISSGHTGAVVGVVDVISCDDVSLPAFVRIRIWFHISVVPETKGIPKIVHQAPLF